MGSSVALWTTSAFAHIELLSPPARYTPDHQKDEPCGHVMNPPGEGLVTVYEVGETISLRFEEFVEHTGHFRVAVDLTGMDDFTSPTDFDDFYNSPQVILDDIPDRQEGGLHTVEVTLPDTPCDPCSLQLIQVMTEDGAFGPGTQDLYFQCADIVLEPRMETGDPPADSSGGGDPSGADDRGTGDEPFGTTSDTPASATASTADSDTAPQGCSCRTFSHPSGMTWLLLGLVGLRRRGARSRSSAAG